MAKLTDPRFPASGRRHLDLLESELAGLRSLARSDLNASPATGIPTPSEAQPMEALGSSKSKPDQTCGQKKKEEAGAC